MDSSHHDIRQSKHRSFHYRKGSRIDDVTEQINREQEKLRKQRDRLESEKRLNKEYSYSRKDRRFSLPSDEIILNVTDKSKRSKPDIKNVKSRLFDFEKTAPRSRLQLQEDGKCPSPSSPMPRVPMATHAIEANKTTHNDIVNNIAMVNNTKYMQKVYPHENSLLGKTDLEKQATMRRSSLSVDHKDLERKCSRRASLNAEHKVHFKKSSHDREHFLHPHDDHRSPRTPSPSTSRTDQSHKPADDTSEAEDTARLLELYNKAIETVQLVDDSLLSPDDHPAVMQYKNKTKRRGSDVGQHDKQINSSGFDLTTLRELESILSDARSYSNRKGASEDHVRLDLGSNRAQKKRIQHLEDVLKRLNPNYDAHKTVLDPAKILQCSYLRLSKSNVEALESMLRDQGKDPGIHVHSDVSTADIWTNMKEERTDLKEPVSKMETKRKVKQPETVHA